MTASGNASRNGRDGLEYTVIVSRAQISCKLAEESVILHLEEGMYYGLNSVGARIWELLQEPRTVREIQQQTADALSFLGGAYLEQGDAGQAIELLAKSVHEWSRFQHRPMLAWFTTLLGEAHLLNGDPARARELAAEGLQIAGGVKFRYGVAWAQRALGRIDRAEGARPAAEGRGHMAGSSSSPRTFFASRF